jgi:hypothetical protein
VNGPENISQHARVPIADQPASAVIRLSPLIARELSLNSGQIIRGFVANDGQAVEFMLANQRKLFPIMLDQWKGRALDFKVTSNNSGMALEPLIDQARSSKNSPNLLNDKSFFSINPRSLATLVANPSFSKLKFTEFSNTKPFIASINSISEAATSRLAAPFSFLLQKINGTSVKRQLQNNGYNLSGVNALPMSADKVVSFGEIISALIGKKNGSKIPGAMNFESEEADLFLEYLEANKIEYLVRQDLKETGIRFVMMFSDFPMVEVYIEGKGSNPKKNKKHKWSIELKLIFGKANSFWGKIELLNDNSLSVALRISDPEMAGLARANVNRLKDLLLPVGVDLTRCTVSGGSLQDEDRKSFLKRSGNLNLRA